MKIIKKLDLLKIELDNPILSENGYYKSKIIYEEDDLYLLLKNIDIYDSFHEEDELIIRDEKTTSMLIDLDNYIVEKIVNNSEKWFGKKLNKLSIERNYRSSIQTSFSEDSYVMISFNRDEDTDSILFEIYDNNKDKINESDIEFPCNAHILLKIDSLIFSKTKVTLNIDIIQIKLNKIKKKERKEKQCLINDSDED